MSAPSHDLERLHRLAGVAVLDFRCGARHPAPGPEALPATDELVFVRTGRFVLETRGERHWIDATRVLRLQRGEPHRIAHPAGCGDTCTVLVLDPCRTAAAALERLRSLPISAPAPGRLQAFAVRATEALREARSDPLAADEIVGALLGGASAALARGDARPCGARSPDGVTRERHRALVEAAHAVLVRHLFEPLRLADVARVVGCSPFHLARLFRAATGVPLHRHQNRLRVRHALVRLAEGCRDLTHLALEMGLSSHSHLDAVFRRELGLPPSALRGRVTPRELARTSKILQARAQAGRHPRSDPAPPIDP